MIILSTSSMALSSIHVLTDSMTSSAHFQSLYLHSFSIRLCKYDRSRIVLAFSDMLLSNIVAEIKEEKSREGGSRPKLMLPIYYIQYCIHRARTGRKRMELPNPLHHLGDVLDHVRDAA